MSKLISNPFECGYADTHPNYRDTVCNNPKIIGLRICNYSTFDKVTGFPTNCPLHDGIPPPKSIEELTEIVKNAISKEQLKVPKWPGYDKVNTPYLQVGPLTHKELSKPIRRNRKDCIHYNKNLVSGRCLDTFRNSYFCVGVNCGCFKTE